MRALFSALPFANLAGWSAIVYLASVGTSNVAPLKREKSTGSSGDDGVDDAIARTAIGEARTDAAAGRADAARRARAGTLRAR